ncbi:hypothetical protein P0Y35_16015 [Kiritimatiellaeota bacterium B1221]|nr:hypothetical protein [Kiritimatiellaeota bacterium B1221]
MIHILTILFLAALFSLILLVPGKWKHPLGASPFQGNGFLFLTFSVGMLTVYRAFHLFIKQTTLDLIAAIISGMLLLVLFFALTLPGRKLDKRHQDPEHDPAPAHNAVQAGKAFHAALWTLAVTFIVLLVL